MGGKYSLEPSHVFLYIKVFMVMFTLTDALCPGLGQLQNGTTYFRYGGIYATFTCNPGLRLLGHVTNSCIRGKWRKPVPVCVANGCHLPSGILHGSLRTSHNNAAITFICNKGYKLFGSEFIYCNGKRWNSTMPVCKEDHTFHLTSGDKISHDYNSSVLSSKEDTQTEPHNINVTKWNTLPNMVPTGKQTIWTTFQTAIKTYTQGPLVSKDPYTKTENYVTSRNVLTSLLPRHVLYLKTTPPKVRGTTRWKQSEEVFPIRNQSPSSHFLITFKGSITPEATSSKSYSLKSTDIPPKHVTANKNIKYITDYPNTEKPIATPASLIPTSIKASIINYTKIVPLSFNQHGIKGSVNKVIHNVTAKKPALQFITTFIPSPPSPRRPSKPMHGIEEIHVTTPSVTTSTHIPHTTKAIRNQIYHGALKNALKRKVWCFYPPVPIHGTFRFLTLKHPLPHQYQYYIQYYCYPGYTMTQGDVYSYCMENGSWSGATPICEDM